MTKLIRKYTKYSGTDNKVNADDQTYRAYQIWMGVKLHMTTEKYDVIKYLGKSTNTSRESMNSYFQKKERKLGADGWCSERTILHRIGRSFDKQKVNTLGVYDIVSYFVYQFTRDRIYLYDMHEDGFKDWLNIVDMYSWEGHFRKDLNIILQNLKNDDGYEDFQSLFTLKNQYAHPKIFKFCLGGDVSIETVLLMNGVLGFIKNINNSIDDISGVWGDFYLKCTKYLPLLKWIFERNIDYATKNPLNIHPSEYYQNLCIVSRAKEIMREIFNPIYG